MLFKMMLTKTACATVTKIVANIKEAPMAKGNREPSERKHIPVIENLVQQ